MDFGKRKHSDGGSSGDDAVGKKRSDVFGNEPRDYSSSEGLKSSVHGTVYQLNLSVLFLQRGLKNEYLFRLAVEMDAAEKFDDLVFQYVKKDDLGRVVTDDENRGKPVFVYRFLQAKHKQDEGKTITYNDLCTADKKGEFGLPKYFISYRAIKQKPEFKRGEIRDYILCTNINLDFDQLKKMKIEFQEITQRDDFLTMKDEKNMKKSARCYKLSPVKAEHELYEILKNTSDLHRLAKELIKHIKLKKSVDLINPIFRSYHAALAQEHVMLIEKVDGKFIAKFKPAFLICTNNGNSSSSSMVATQNGLSERAIKLREIMKEYEEQSKVSIDGNSELIVSSTFGKAFQLIEDPQLTDVKKFTEEFVSLLRAAQTETVLVERRKAVIKDNIDKLAGHVLVEMGTDRQVQFSTAFLNLNHKLPGDLKSFREELIKSLGSNSTTLAQFQFKISNFFTCAEGELYARAQLPRDAIKNAEISDFFDKLVFAVNQPNEVELSDIIKAEIGADFNLIDSDFVASYVQKIMLDWFKEKGSRKGAEGTFFTYADGAQLLAATQQKVAQLILVSSKLEYEGKIEKLGVTFKADVVEKLMLADFLTEKNTSTAQVLHLVTEHPTLTAIKLYQSLKHIDKYQKDDSYIFKCLLSLLRLQNQVLQAFKSNTCDLLVIECARDNTIKDMDIRLLVSKLCTNINSNYNKKIILISYPAGDFLSHLLSNEIEPNKYEKAADNKLSLTDLTEESQVKLLKHGKMILHEREMALIDLIDDTAKDLIDSTTLIKLINEEVINLGGNDLSNFSNVGYDADYYIERTFNRHIQIKPSIFQKKKNTDLFAISGVSENQLHRLGVERQKWCLFAEVEPNLTRRVIVLEDEEERAREQFEELCRLFTSSNIHWLRSEKLIWQQSHGSVSSLVHYKSMGKIYKSIQSTITVYSEENVLLGQGEEEQHKVVIISDTAGMGKSTLLINFFKTIPTTILTADDQDHRAFWVIRINLNNYTKVLEEEVKHASFNKNDLESLIYFFLETLLGSQEQSRLKSGLEKRLIANSFREPSSKIKLVLLFDSFDEISPDYKDVVVNLLQGLTRAACVEKLFVTTRPNFREVLEEKFHVFAYTLESFSEKNQVDFLVKFWKKKLALKTCAEENEDGFFLEFSKIIVNKFNSSIKDKDKEFTGIPLQLRMIAEVFQESPRDNRSGGGESSWQGCKEYVEANYNKKSNRGMVELPEKIDLLSLYEYFVRKKFYDLHWLEKKKVDFTKPGTLSLLEKGYSAFLKGHQLLAAHLLLSQVHFNDISSKKERKKIVINWIENIKNGKENAGIIDKIINEKAHFIHLTFAEYFMSCHFVRKLLLSETHFVFTIECINSVIANTSPLFLNKIVKLLDTDSKRKEKFARLLKGQTWVNLVTAQGCLSFVKALLEAGFQDYPTPDTLGRTPLHCAAIHSHHNILSYLLEINNDIEEGNGSLIKKEDSELVKYVNKADIYGETAVFYAAKNASLEIGYDMDEYYATAKSFNAEIERDNVAYYSAKRVNLGIARTLLSRGANIVALKEYVKAVIQYVTNEETNMYSEDAELRSIVETFLLQAPHTVLECVEKCVYPRLLHPFIKRGRVDVVSSLFSLLPADDELTKKSILNDTFLCYTPLDWVNLSDKLSDEDRLRITKYLVENGGVKTMQYRDYRNNYSKSTYVTNILEAAATHGHLRTFRAFIDEESADCFHKHLYSAATYQHINVIQYLLENYGEKLRDERGNCALHIAVNAGASLKIIKYLVDNGAMINARNDKGETALFTAIHANHKMNVIQFLVENGTDVNVVDKLSKTALHSAIEKDQLDIIKYLLSLQSRKEKLKFSSFLDEKSDIFHANGLHLHLAIRARDFKWSRFLVRRGADVNKKDKRGKTPLHWAAQLQQAQIVELLLQYSAVYDERDVNNQTPLDLISQRTDDINDELDRDEVNDETTPDDVISQPDIFLEADDDDGGERDKIIWLLNVINEFFNSQDLMEDFKQSLMNRDGIAVNWGAYGFGLLEVLAENNPILFVLNARNAEGKYLLHVAGETNDFLAFQFLFKWNDDYLRVKAELPELFTTTMDYHPISVDAVDFRGNTPLHLAAQYGQQLLASNLLEHGAMCDPQNHAGDTPESLASSAGHEAIAKMLQPNKILFKAFAEGDLEEVKKCMEGSAYLNAKEGRSGRTALHFAAALGHADIAHSLLKYEAHVDAIDTRGQTPLHLATINNNMEIVKLLLRHRASVSVVDRSGKTSFAAECCDKKNQSGNLVSAVNELFNVVQSDNPKRIIDDLNRVASVYGLDLSSIVNVRDNCGKSLLHYAVKGNYIEVAQFLLENGAIYDVKSKWHYAVKRNIEIKKDMITLIDGMFSNVTSIVEKAQIISTRIIANVRNVDGRTLLHEAAMYGNLKAVKWLVENGANVQAEDFCGHTALYLVTKANKDMYIKIIEFLKLRSVVETKVGKRSLE